MKETALDRIKSLINKDKRFILLHKRLNGIDWYVGEVESEYKMVREVLQAKDFKKSNHKSKWFDMANRNFAKGWDFKEVKVNRNGEIIHDKYSN